MIPFPNLLAGAAIGLSNDSWFSVLVCSLIWPIVFCAYAALVETDRIKLSIAQHKEKAQRLLFSSPTATVFATELVTSLLTALPVSLITFALKRAFL